MNFLKNHHVIRRVNSFFDFKKIVLLLICFGINSVVFSQILKDVDAIYPFHEDLASAKKDGQWAFINREGEKIIDFRKDLVSTQSTDGTSSYPTFVEGKCLIKKMIDGVYYYGYIDKKGTTVIEPQYLNATNFVDGYALIIKHGESTIGTNVVLGKKMISSKLEEYVIDATGKIIKFLDNSRAYTEAHMKTSPNFKSKFIAPNLVAVKTNKRKWDIHKF